MKGRYFDEFRVGDRFRTAGWTVTETHIVSFCGAVGLHEPLFTNRHYMETATAFGGLVAPGPMILATAAAQFGTESGWFDGTVMAMVGIDNVRFKAPLRRDDTMYVNVEIVALTPTRKPGRGIVTQRLTVENQRGEAVLEFEMSELVMAKPA
jgi:acyl dehydratase